MPGWALGRRLFGGLGNGNLFILDHMCGCVGCEFVCRGYRFGYIKKFK